MPQSPASFNQIRKIDNSGVFLPIATFFLIIILAFLAIWFFRGGSFRLYASAFFGLYFLTRQVWISVLLIGLLQSVVFLPLRFIGLKLWNSVRDFEDELEDIKSEDQQYFVFKEKVRKGDVSVLFFIFNFIVNAIAFLSAGRIFLIDFYTRPLDPNLIYHFVPYPQYPLQGTDFYFPFFKILKTVSLGWNKIFLIWFSISIFFALIRLLWRPFKLFLWKNQKILSVRINYNRLLLQIGGFGGTLMILSIIFLRNIPISFQGLWLIADLTRQNTTMNIITAIGTFITTLHAGYVRHTIGSKRALQANFPQEVVDRVFKEKMRESFRNAVFLGLGAFLVTNQIPCAFELSVATFEVLYILSPYTFDKFLTANSHKSSEPEIIPAPSS